MLQNLQQEKGIFWTLPASIIMNLLFGIQVWSAIGLAFTFFYILQVIRKMGHTIPIIDLMTGLAALQWIVGPYIDYNNDVTHYKYYMYVPEEQYMPYVVPALIAFRLGTLFFKDNSNLESIGQKVNALLNRYPKLPYLFVVIGLVVPYLNSIIPPALRFVFFLLANIKYVGVIYLLFSGRPNRWPVFIGVMTLTALASIASGMFHDLLLWAMLTFTFVARELKFSMMTKVFATVLAIFLAMTIQSVKHEYRSIIKAGYGGNKVGLFTGLAMDNWRSGRIVTPTNEEEMTARLNQGWIISAVMKNVPERTAYAGGSTILAGLEAALLPRILAPNKKKAGGRENFMKYTGLHLGDNTSMGISLAGEGYANYGYYGGILFMFLWGVFIGWFWQKLFSLSTFYPTLLIWSPILFLQVIKAETELVVVLNHLVKASVLVFGLLWFVKRQWGIRV